MPCSGVFFFQQLTLSGSTCVQGAPIPVSCANPLLSTTFWFAHTISNLSPNDPVVLRVYGQGGGKCYRINGTDSTITGANWDKDTLYIPYSTTYSAAACRACNQSVLLVSCADPQGFEVAYGAKALALKNLLSTNGSGYTVKIISTIGDAPTCWRVYYIEELESIIPGLYNTGSTDPPIDWDSTYPDLTYSIPSPNNCATCSSTVKCIRLVDCATDGLIYDYYLEDTDAVGQSLIPLVGSVYQLTIPDTLVNEVTGLPPAAAFTSCFKILSSDREPGGSPGCIKHSVEIVQDGSNCNSCGFCFRFVSCDDPSEAYTVKTSDEDFYEAVQVCEQNGLFGSVLTIKIDLQDGKGYRCFKVEACSDSGPFLILDEYAPLVYESYCDTTPCSVCLIEPICYQVTMCESGQQVILQDPMMEDGGDIPLGNYYEGRIELDSNVLIGCFTIEEIACGGLDPAPVTGANIVIDDSPRLAYDSCEACKPPPTYKLSRCDDPGVFYIVNNDGVDIAPLASKVIRGLELYNCASGTTPCVIKPEQCWLVTQWTPGDTAIQVSAYDTRPAYIFSNNDDITGCECCLETTYVPPTE